MIKAVIFDMDGVLIDSEILYLRYQAEKLRESYPWIKDEHLYPLVGMDNKEYKIYLADLLGHDANDPAFLKEMKELSDGIASPERIPDRSCVKQFTFQYHAGAW